MSEHVSAEKNDEVEPSMAFWGMPAPSVEICIGALPAATLSTEMKKKYFKIAQKSTNYLFALTAKISTFNKIQSD